MPSRRSSRLGRPLRRGAILQAASVVCLLATVTAAQPEHIVSANYFDPTDRYPHGVFGDPVEWAAISILLSAGTRVSITLPGDHVFEDTEPRLADMDGDGDAEIVVIETDMALGASIAVYDETGKVADTPHIGTRNRWLAIAGIADLDGDGLVEIAYVDRPHLAKTLRVVEMRPTVEGWELADEAAANGFTNHRYGSPTIEGGVFDCGNGPEIITADAEWRRALATRLDGRALVSRDIGAYSGSDSLRCP